MEIVLRALSESDFLTTLNWNNQTDIRDLYIWHSLLLIKK